MIEKIIFLYEYRFNLRDYRRFGVELLGKNGFRVEVWDSTPILHPELSQSCTSPDIYNFDGLKLFDDIRKMRSKLSNLSRSDFVINLLGYNFLSLGINKALSKSPADYAVFYANAMPNTMIRQEGLGQLVENFKKLPKLRHPKVRKRLWKRLFMKLPPKWLGVKPARLILAGGNRCLDHPCQYPVDKNSEVLYIHTLDYDLYLEEKDKRCVERPIAVFLDEFLPFHPDCMLYTDVDRYYSLLNNFFERIERELGLEVVIAAHPRSTYEKLPDYFKGRKCIRGKTVSLIRQCKLALCYGSTSVYFVNLFYKPAVFMTFSDLDKIYYGAATRELARQFGKKPISLDRDIKVDWERELRVDKAIYDNLRRAYIKAEHSSDLPFWKVVANRLKKLKVR